jgi:hypothetical protein
VFNYSFDLNVLEVELLLWRIKDARAQSLEPERAVEAEMWLE